MNTNNMALRAAVVIALGTTPIIASANAIYSPSTPAVLARELDVVNGATIAFKPEDHNLKFSIVNLKGRTVDTNFPFEMRLTLTNGATFGAAVSANSLQCGYLNGVVNVLQPAQNMLGGPDTTQAVFKFPGGKISSDVPYCLFSGAINLTSGSKGGDMSYNMTSTAYIYSQVSPSDSVFETMEGAVITFRQAYQASLSYNSHTIDVASPSFATKFLAPSKAQSAEMGTVKYTEVAGYNYKLFGGVFTKIADPGADILAGDTTITLSGSPLQSRGTVVIGSNSLANAAAPCASVLNFAAGVANNAKTASTTGIVTFSVLKADMGNPLGISFCYMVDGATRLSKGLVTMDISTPSAAGMKPVVDIAGDKTLAKFFKNGTSVKVLTIPDPTDTNNPLNIRIYNMGGSETNVYGSLYTVAGTSIGSPNQLLGTLKTNSVLVLKTTDLATKFQVPKWTDGGVSRAWMQIEGDSQQIRVQVLAKSGGIMINMSDRALEDGGKFKRSDTP